jgi:hypothetical protein
MTEAMLASVDVLCYVYTLPNNERHGAGIFIKSRQFRAHQEIFSSYGDKIFTTVNPNGYR